MWISDVDDEELEEVELEGDMLIDTFDDAVEEGDAVDQLHDVVEEVTGNRPERKKTRLSTIGFIQ